MEAAGNSRAEANATSGVAPSSGKIVLFLRPLQGLDQAFLTAQSKNLPAMQETQVQFLGWEDLLEKEILQPIPVFLPGESHGQRSLAGYSLWGCKSLTRLNQHQPMIGSDLPRFLRMSSFI